VIADVTHRQSCVRLAPQHVIIFGNQVDLC